MFIDAVEPLFIRGSLFLILVITTCTTSALTRDEDPSMTLYGIKYM